MGRGRHRPARIRPRHRSGGRVGSLLRTEAVGGALLVAAAAAAVAIANSPLRNAYDAVRDWRLGPSALDLHLSVGEWTADGLLAIFFFLAGLELKHELLVGELRDVRRAVVPVVAAVGGMAAPAVIYLAINATHPGDRIGWAIPTATDIAFALAVLAVVGRHLPGAVRSFLLTLAVVDDLLAITIIAVFYTSGVRLGMAAIAVAAVVAFAVAVRRYGHRLWVRWALMVPLALVAWAAMHASGIHATVAGVLLGFAVPVIPHHGDSGCERANGAPDRAGASRPGIAARLDRWVRPVSAGLAVPLFAFFAAGVRVGGIGRLAGAFGDTVTLGVAVGLVAGKAVGIFVATLVTAVIVRSSLLRAISTVDLAGLAILGGVGFTVSLLIGDLAFAAAPERHQDVQIGVLAGSLTAAVAAGIILGIRNRHYRATAARDGREAEDGRRGRGP